MIELLYIIIAMLCGGVATWLIVSRASKSSAKADDTLAKLSQADSDLRIANDRLERMNAEISTKSSEIEQLQSQKSDLSVQLTTISTRYQEQGKHYEALERERTELNKAIEGRVQENQKLSHQVSEGLVRIESLKQQNETIGKDLSETKQELQHTQKQHSAAREQVVEFENENRYLKEMLETQKQEVEDIGKKFSAEFKLLADSILEDKSRRFTETNQTNLERLLKPLGENIILFQRKVEEVYDRESKERFSLGKEVEKLVMLNQQISQEAQNLTNALKGQVKQQGNWGEMILESILEKSGLTKGREYSVQESVKDEEGRRFQPDVIISYPDERKVVIDSKVSLIAYERYCSAASPQEQEKALAEHFRSIRSHVDSLSQKNYQDLVGSLDFVMMFVPVEPAFILAMQSEQDLWSYAYTRGVLLISPTNLIAALKLIYDLWQREYQNRHAIEIAERGGQLYDKFVGFVENLNSIGDNLSRTQKSYSAAIGQLTEGRGNLIFQVEKLKQLGAKAKKSIPQELMNELDEEGGEDDR